MLVTGAQPVGAKGVTAVQGVVVDTRQFARAGIDAGGGERRGNDQPRTGAPQPVVFPRADVGVDQRPVGLRREQAAARYRAYGGAGDGDHDEAA